MVGSCLGLALATANSPSYCLADPNAIKLADNTLYLL